MLRVTTYCFKVLHCISVCMVKSIRSGFLSLLNHRTLYLTVHGKLEVFFVFCYLSIFISVTIDFEEVISL